MEEKSKKATQEGVNLEAIASWQEAHIFRPINQRKSYREGFVDGAKWMLEHPTGGELLHVCNKTAAITKREMIDKACEWLEENMEDYTEWFNCDEGECQHHAISSDYDYKKDFIEALRKAMEERQ